MFLKKLDPAANGRTAGGSCHDPEFASTFPGLWEYLSSHTYDDGSPRVSSTLLVFVEDGLVKLCLNDRDQGMVSFLSAPTYAEALLEMDHRVVEGKLEWRLSKMGSGRKR